MMRFRLSDADRARFGCEEWLTVDLDAVTNKEAATVQRLLGFDDHIQVAHAFNAQWPRDEAGAVDVARARTDYGAWDAVVWLALRQAGHLTARSRTELVDELEALVYEVIQLRVRGDDAPTEARETSDDAG